MKASSDPEFARFKNADFAAAKPVTKTPHLRKLQAQAGGKSRITLPETLKSFVDEQGSQRGYGTSSEYVRELIRKDHDRLQLRKLLLKSAGSKPAAPADKAYFDSLRKRVRSTSKS